MVSRCEAAAIRSTGRARYRAPPGTGLGAARPDTEQLASPGPRCVEEKWSTLSRASGNSEPPIAVECEVVQSVGWSGARSGVECDVE